MFSVSDQVRIKQSSDTSVSLWFNESFIGIKFSTPEKTAEFQSKIEDIIFRF